MSDVVDRQWLARAIAEAWTVEPPDPIEWGETNVIFPGSARSRHFNCEITPWIREPIYRAAQGLWTPAPDHYLDCSVEARIVTLMKPVQSGGSAFGELILLYWIMFARGILQYNWSNDKRAKERWESRIDGILRACVVVKALIDSLPAGEANKMEIDFVRLFLRVQGAFVDSNLDSDSIPLQINEEIHDWVAGHLKKARARSTAVWNFKSIDISNAGKIGDQLSQAFDSGTRQEWEVLCPGCSNLNHRANWVFHKMRTRWEDRRPQLGGLRYDSDAAKISEGRYDYNVVRRTIRFQMPCGHVVHDDPTERRSLSLSGKYSEPVPGSDLTHRSYTYQGVTVDYIDWTMLVREKNEALFARRNGDIEPWRRYQCERECVPFDPDDVPIGGRVVIQTGTKKNRVGLEVDQKLRLGNLDRQQGNQSRGELPHWWGTIRDYAFVDGKIKSLLVYEGRLETDGQAAAVMKDHGVAPWNVVADSGDDTTHVYLFCMENGFHAIKGSASAFFPHEGPRGTKASLRIFSPERPLHAIIGCEQMYEYIDMGDRTSPDPREPMFFLYSKAGIRERLHWLRTSTEFMTPGDASEDYQLHMESEERISTKHPTTGETIHKWIQQRTRNDLFVCEAYGAMQLDMAGWIGAEVAQALVSGSQNAKNKA